MKNRRRAWKTFSRIGLGYGVFLLAPLLLQIEAGVLVVLLSQVGPAALVSELGGFMEKVRTDFADWLIIGSSVITYGFGGLLTYLIVKDMPIYERREKKRADWKMLATAFFISMCVLYFGNIIGQVLMTAVCTLLNKPMINPVEEVIDGLSTWSVFTAMVVIAPVCEEFFYRKVLIDRIRQYGDWTAIAASAFVFGLSHGNFYQFFYAFGLGAVFAYVYLKTGRLRYTILFHALINFTGSVAVLYAMDHPWFMVLYAVFMLGSVILGAVLFWRSRKKLVFEEGIERLRGLAAWNVILLNPGMVLFFLVSSAFFISSELL